MADPADVEASVPLIAVTAAVGAVVLLLVLLCNVGKKQEKEEQEEKGSAMSEINFNASSKLSRQKIVIS